MSFLFISYIVNGHNGYLLGLYSHIFVSTLLFKLIGYLPSYTIYNIKSIMNYKPFYYYLFFFIFIINAGLPYSLSFLSELEIIRDLNTYSPSLINYIIRSLNPFLLL